VVTGDDRVDVAGVGIPLTAGEGGPVDAGGDGGVTEPGHPPCAIDPNRHVT
jgi:hypothetical protein